jgi:hypothetical protein
MVCWLDTWLSSSRNVEDRSVISAYMRFSDSLDSGCGACRIGRPVPASGVSAEVRTVRDRVASTAATTAALPAAFCRPIIQDSSVCGARREVLVGSRRDMCGDA